MNQFMQNEGLATLDADGKHFSGLPCDCCGCVTGQLYDCTAYSPVLGVVEGYLICEDCVVEAEYGAM